MPEGEHVDEPTEIDLSVPEGVALDDPSACTKEIGRVALLPQKKKLSREADGDGDKHARAA